MPSTDLVVVLHDRPLPTASVDPGDKVFHIPGDHHGGVRDWGRSDPDVTLLDRPYGLLMGDWIGISVPSRLDYWKRSWIAPASSNLRRSSETSC